MRYMVLNPSMFDFAEVSRQEALDWLRDTRRGVQGTTGTTVMVVDPARSNVPLEALDRKVNNLLMDQELDEC